MKKRVKKKTYWMQYYLTKGWYLRCHKHPSHKSQCISKYLFPWENLSFEREFNNQFNNLIIAIKLSRTRSKDSWCSQAAAVICIDILSFFCQNHWKILWKCSFLAMLQTMVQPTATLRKTFSIRTLPMLTSVYANNFLKTKRSKHI